MTKIVHLRWVISPNTNIMEQYDWKQSKFYLTYKFKKKFNHTSFLIISRVSFNRSMSLETPLGISKIVSCKAWVWLRIITFKSFKVVHRVLNSNSSRRSKIKQVLPLFWIKISVNWVVMSAGRPFCSMTSSLSVVIMLYKLSRARHASSESPRNLSSTSTRTGIAWVPTSSLYFFDRDLISTRASRRSSISEADWTRSQRRSI